MCCVRTDQRHSQVGTELHARTHLDLLGPPLIRHDLLFLGTSEAAESYMGLFY